MIAGHPDQEFAAFILRGIWEGFRIGFDPDHTLVSARRNTPSAQQHPEVVEQYLTREISAGRIIGPFPPHRRSRSSGQPDGGHPQSPPAEQVAVDHGPVLSPTH